MIIHNNDCTSMYMLEHGNVIPFIVHWNDTITDHGLPDSYYHNFKSSFFNNHNWPAFGPDIKSENILPAQICFKSKVIIK